MNKNTLEALVGKKVMFGETLQKQGAFYYDATIKKINDLYFLKYNRPNYDIFDFDREVSIEGETKRKITINDIIGDIGKNLSDSYKFSYEISLDDSSNDNRYKRIVELNAKNIIEELKA